MKVPSLFQLTLKYNKSGREYTFAEDTLNIQTPHWFTHTYTTGQIKGNLLKFQFKNILEYHI